MNRLLGAWGEQIAVDHLLGLGWTIADRNWRCDAGELDIVALEPLPGRPPCVVVVEVKAKAGTRYGPPLEAITHRKLNRLRALAVRWVREHPGVGLGLRLDAVGVLKSPGCAPRLTHVRGAS
ncbi:MAG: YraN family protein [Propionibacteriaceae bacterium]|nr:YraN family protein [Propionibacteriaceae bacterium]